jgi:hypothetical protein
MMKFRCAVLSLFCAAANPWPAVAADIVLDGEAACVSIGGTWSGAACTVDRLTVPADIQLFTIRGVALLTGDLVIDGLLQIEGDFEATRTLHNRGTLITASFIVNQAQMLNQGYWLNQGEFLSDETVVNEGYFETQGVFQARTGEFINRMYTVIFSGGNFLNSGGLMVNEGYVANNGFFNNPAGSTLDNAGVILTYDATFINFGRALGRCGSANYFPPPPPPSFFGNPFELEPCTDAVAVGALADYVFDLGKRRLLDKHDAIELRNILKKSSKRLEKGDQAEGLALLQAFIAEVPRRTGFPVSDVLLARGFRALELVTSP